MDRKKRLRLERRREGQQETTCELCQSLVADPGRNLLRAYAQTWLLAQSRGDTLRENDPHLPTPVEWLGFLKKLHRQTPAGLALHLIVDNYATHTHPVVRVWLEKHPRIHVHFIPTGSSWLNLVEHFFRQLTDEVVREGSFTSVADLVAAIDVHLAHHNLKPKSWRWKADGASILEKIQRARQAQAKVDM